MAFEICSDTEPGDKRKDSRLSVVVLGILDLHNLLIRSSAQEHLGPSYLQPVTSKAAVMVPAQVSGWRRAFTLRSVPGQGLGHLEHHWALGCPDLFYWLPTSVAWRACLAPTSTPGPYQSCPEAWLGHVLAHLLPTTVTDH